MGTDVMFCYSLQGSESGLSYVATICVVITFQALLVVWYLELKLFKHNHKERLNINRMVSFRWGLYVFTPWEDIVMTIMAGYLFLNGTGSFEAVISLAISLSTIVFLRICYIIFESRGLLTQNDEIEPDVNVNGGKPEVGLSD